MFIEQIDITITDIKPFTFQVLVHRYAGPERGHLVIVPADASSHTTGHQR